MPRRSDDHWATRCIERTRDIMNGERRIGRHWATRCIEQTRDIGNGERPVPRRSDRSRHADRRVEETCGIENPE